MTAAAHLHPVTVPTPAPPRVDLLRRDRTDKASGAVHTGVVHIGDEQAPGRTLCGNRPRKVTARWRGPVTEATCTGCTAAHRANHTQPHPRSTHA